MMLTLLTVTGIVIGLSAVYVLSTKSRPVEVLASETTMVGMTDPASETLPVGQEPTALPAVEWHLTTVSALSDAEELLDALENQGCTERELLVLGNSCFAVRWR
ncbi:MAG: hypothetical protein L0241_26010 [Planctomycetia bacterium]|nr:hypothetical protein [Planctomycetia bacterium]